MKNWTKNAFTQVNHARRLYKKNFAESREIKKYAYDMMSHNIESMFTVFKIEGLVCGWIDRASKNLWFTNKGMIKIAMYFIKVHQSKEIHVLGFPWKNCLYMKEMFPLNKLETYNYLGWFLYYNANFLGLLHLYNGYNNALIDPNGEHTPMKEGITIKESILRACMMWTYANMCLLDSEKQLVSGGNLNDVHATKESRKVFHINPFILKSIIKADYTYTTSFGNLLSNAYTHNYLRTGQSKMQIEHNDPDRIDIDTVDPPSSEAYKNLQMNSIKPFFRDTKELGQVGFNIQDSPYIQRMLDSSPSNYAYHRFQIGEQ
jgi:hypothetical protein